MERVNQAIWASQRRVRLERLVVEQVAESVRCRIPTNMNMSGGEVGSGADNGTRSHRSVTGRVLRDARTRRFKVHPGGWPRDTD